MLRELKAPLAIVCHDAGATNHILAWLAAEPVDCRVHAEGPAERLCRQHPLPGPLAGSLEAALDGAASLISGTGWASDLEHRARCIARDRGLHSVAVVDHWVNYAMRFERAGTVQLPDEIWVTDDLALAEARRCFPATVLREQPNLYLQAQLRGIAPVQHAGPDLLVVLEPMRSTWGRDIDGEFQALDHLIRHLPALRLAPGAALRLRPHPSEAPGKYDVWIARHAHLGARLDEAPDLAAALTDCAIVAGCRSYALVVALAAGRRVVCMLPPWAPPDRLPHPGIVSLSDLVTT